MTSSKTTRPALISYRVSFHPAWPPDSQRPLTIRDAAANPNGVKVANVVGVRVTDENFVQIVIEYLHGGQSLGAAKSNVEDKLFSIAKLNQEAYCGLFGTSIGLPRAASDDAHSIWS